MLKEFLLMKKCLKPEKIRDAKASRDDDDGAR